ncbi:MAG: hypothetical protein JWM09_1236 [Francisellaceae bacterium]|nr:hypothetical protein [Francisellaceae bacterium]
MPLSPKVTISLKNRTYFENNLDLSNSYINKIDIQELINLCKNNNTITSLNLSGNNIKELEFLDLLAMFISQTKITELNLSNCELGENLKKLSLWLPNLEKIFNTLTHVNFENNDLGFTGLELILKMLANNKNIIRINIANNVKYQNSEEVKKEKNNKDRFIEALALLLNTNPNLKEIDLGTNQIGKTGLNKLNKLLTGKVNLDFLNLSLNQVRDEDDENDANPQDQSFIASINELLSLPFVSIKHLSLAENEIRNIDCETLLEIIHKNSSLEEIDLRYTEIAMNSDKMALIKNACEQNKIKKIANVRQKQNQLVAQSLDSFNTSMVSLTLYNSPQKSTRPPPIIVDKKISQASQEANLSKRYIDRPHHRRQSALYIGENMKEHAELTEEEIEKKFHRSPIPGKSPSTGKSPNSAKTNLTPMSPILDIDLNREKGSFSSGKPSRAQFHEKPKWRY